MNVLHLYGNIVDVFEGKVNPSSITKTENGISDDVSFGLGVSCFEDDLSNIGDAVYFNRRFFIRSTDEGQKRDPLNRKFIENYAQKYRTVYSLGVTKHPLEMQQKRILQNDDCQPGITVESLIGQIIGFPRSLDCPPRTFGFLGLFDYDELLSTSLSNAPIHGENIIPLMKKYARDQGPLRSQSGLVMGFVRDRTRKDDDPETIALNHRLFFDNPKDREAHREELASKSDSPRSPHWISHTHGLRFNAGQSVFPNERRLFARMSEDEVFCETVIQRALANGNLDDCGHVIPRSRLRRYFVIAFPIHKIEAFN